MELKKAVYTISEAAEYSACSPEQIIKKSIAGKFQLYVRTPVDLDLYNAGYGEIHLDRVWRHEGEKPKSFRQPDIAFLVVSDEMLEQLLGSGLFMAATFLRGARIGKLGDVEIVEALAPDFWPGMLSPNISIDAVSRCFATYFPGADIDAPGTIRHPRRFEISVDDLVLDRPSMKLLSGANHGIRPLGFPELDVQPYTGPKLRGFYSLFCRIWGHWGATGFVSPTSRLVYDALINEFNFAAYIAEQGVRVILTDVLLDKDNLTGAPRIVAKMMNNLIDGSHSKWKPEPAQSLPNPTSAEVMDWFIERDWSNSAAKTAAVIIRPDYAPMGRNTG